MEKDTAMIVTSFGTTHPDALQKCIAATERAIASRFPGLPVYRAFLSPTVIRRLKEKSGIDTDDLVQALERVRDDGFKNAVVQPTLVLSGIEYGLVHRTVRGFTGLHISVGRPLIADENDCEAVAGILMGANCLKDGEALVLTGHGTAHSANGIYGKMQDVFDRAGYRAYIATIDGTPDLKDAVERLRAGGARSARLLPLLFVAGDHAKNDMAGPDGNSLLSLVEQAGVKAVPILRGLGEDASVRTLYAQRAEKALKELNV